MRTTRAINILTLLYRLRANSRDGWRFNADRWEKIVEFLTTSAVVTAVLWPRSTRKKKHCHSLIIVSCVAVIVRGSRLSPRTRSRRKSSTHVSEERRAPTSGKKKAHRNRHGTFRARARPAAQLSGVISRCI